MPKMKTKSGAKKRFKVTGKGKVVGKGSFTRHMMMNKSRKQKRKQKGTKLMSFADAATILRSFMPNAKRQRVANRTTTKSDKGAA